MKSRIASTKSSKAKKASRGGQPVRQRQKITFEVPTHIADFVEATKPKLNEGFTMWAQSPIEQALGHAAFESCESEFRSLFIDGYFTFDDRADEKKFMDPLLRALRKAHSIHQARAT